MNIDGREIRKGAWEAMEALANAHHRTFPADTRAAVESISKSGGTPLVVACDGDVLGAIELKDVVKGGIKERFSELRRMVSRLS